MPSRRTFCTQLLSALLLAAAAGPGAPLTHAQPASTPNQNARAASSQVTAAGAAEIVRQQYGGRIMDVQTRQRDGRIIYQVRVLQDDGRMRSEEHTSELQSRGHIVCRLLPEKKKIRTLLILSSYIRT